MTRQTEPIDLTERDGAVSFRVWAQPGARMTELAGVREGALKLRIAAPPVDGKANKECVRFLSELLGVSRSAVEITSGLSSKTKIVRVRNIDRGRVLETLKSESMKDVSGKDEG